MTVQTVEFKPSPSVFEPKFLPKSAYKKHIPDDLTAVPQFITDDLEYQTLSTLFKVEEDDDGIFDDFEIEASQSFPMSPSPMPALPMEFDSIPSQPLPEHISMGLTGPPRGSLRAANAGGFVRGGNGGGGKTGVGVKRELPATPIGFALESRSGAVPGPPPGKRPGGGGGGGGGGPPAYLPIAPTPTSRPGGGAGGASYPRPLRPAPAAAAAARADTRPPAPPAPAGPAPGPASAGPPRPVAPTPPATTIALAAPGRGGRAGGGGGGVPSPIVGPPRPPLGGGGRGGGKPGGAVPVPPGLAASPPGGLTPGGRGPGGLLPHPSLAGAPPPTGLSRFSGGGGARRPPLSPARSPSVGGGVPSPIVGPPRTLGGGGGGGGGGSGAGSPALGGLGAAVGGLGLGSPGGPGARGGAHGAAAAAALRRSGSAASLGALSRSGSLASLDGLGGEPESEADRKERRRERNRLLARKTRLRKKFFFEALQKKAAALRRENARLREAVRRRVGAAEAQRVLAGCHAALPQVVVECTDQAAALLARPDHTMLGLLQDLRPSFCVTDPNLPDNPIVFVSNGFLRLTGYAREQVIGRNCRFLQGPGTDPAAIAKLRASIGEGKDVSVLFLNYKADRTPFWNNVFIAALRDRGGRVVNFVGVQNPVDAERADEDGGPTGSPPPPLPRGPPGGGSGGGGRGASPGGPPFIPGPPGAPPMLPPSTSGGPHGRGAGAGGAGGGMLSVV